LAGGDLILADGFDSNSTIGWNSGEYVSTSSSYSRVSGSGCGLYFSRTDTYFTPEPVLYADSFTATSEFLLGFAFKLTSIVAGVLLVTFKDGTAQANNLCAFYINGSGKLAFGRRNTGNPYDGISTNLATGATTLQANRWYFVEAKLKINSSTGYIEVKLDGTTDISMTTSLNTTSSGNNYAIDICLNESDTAGVGTAGLYFDDIYLFDNTGNGMSYIGDIRVLDLVPTSDGTYSDFTPSTGINNYATIDELPSVDTDYVYTNTVGSTDTYGFQNLPANATAVFGVVYVTRSFKTDAGSRTLRNVMRQGSTDYERSNSDTPIPVNASTTFYSETVNPATSVAYTVSDINDNEFGFKLQA
jgi:hypothetical protein